MSRWTFWKIVNPALGIAFESMDRARSVSAEPRRVSMPEAKSIGGLDPSPVYRSLRRKDELLVDDAWELMEADRRAAEADKASAQALVDAMYRAAESEAQGGSK